MNISLKNLIKGKDVSFHHYNDGKLWYHTDDHYFFPIPLSDVGTATFKRKDRAIYFMRWISPQLDKGDDVQFDTGKCEGKKIRFEYFRDKALWYKTEEGLLFPIMPEKIGTIHCEASENDYQEYVKKYSDEIKNSPT